MKVETNKIKQIKLNNKKFELSFGTLVVTSSLLLMLSNNVYALQKKKSNGNFVNYKILEYQQDEVNKTIFNEKKEFIINCIYKYSKIYNLNGQDVETIIYNKSNLISEKIIYRSYSDLEIDSLKLVRNIKRNIEKYDIRKSSEEYIKNKSIREIVKNYSNLFQVDSNLVFAIECLESGYYECDIAIKKNNPGSLRSTDKFNVYENIEQGIIDHVLILKRVYMDKGLNTIEEIGEKYCPDDPAWAERVNNIYNQLLIDENNIKIYDEIFENEGVKKYENKKK